MPNPLEIFLNPLSLVFLSLYAGLMIYEALFPARPLPKVRFWQLRGMIAFTVYFLLSSYLPIFWDGVLLQWQLFDLSSLHATIQFTIGLLVYEFILYCWHRTLHSSDTLWQGFHQMHHSAERVDTYGAFWISPLDTAGFTMVGSLAFILILGLTAQVTTALLLFTFFMAVFQHSNIRTPRWIGYFIQRPESHTFHHAKNIHRNNYADIPVFDMIFGTFVNPKEPLDTGFYQGASSRVVDMLLFKDINKDIDNNTVTLEAL